MAKLNGTVLGAVMRVGDLIKVSQSFSKWFTDIISILAVIFHIKFMDVCIV